MLEQRINMLCAAPARTDNRRTFLRQAQDMLASGASTRARESLVSASPTEAAVPGASHFLLTDRLSSVGRWPMNLLRLAM
jgi:hypothetical protein